MIDAAAQLLLDYRALTAEMEANRDRHATFINMRTRWSDEHNRRSMRAWQAQLEADLIDPDCTPLEPDNEHVNFKQHTCCCHHHHCR